MSLDSKTERRNEKLDYVTHHKRFQDREIILKASETHNFSLLYVQPHISHLGNA